MKIAMLCRCDCITAADLEASQRVTRALIRALSKQLEVSMSENQQHLDALTDSVNTGVQELKTEIDRLANLPAGDPIDFSRLQALADALASDNIPAAPPVQ